MSVIGVMIYHWRRRWTLTTMYVLIVTLIAFLSMFALIHGSREVSMAVDTNGMIVEHVSYNGVAFASDPSRIFDASAFAALIGWFAILTIRRDRWFLVSLSVPRYRILVGTQLFLVALSVALALLGGLIVPVLCRMVLWGVGFPVSGGWSLSAVLTGNDNNLLIDLYLSICNMIFSAGLYSLLGYVFMRWWKIIAIVFGAGILTIILLVSMIQLETVLAQFALRIADWAQWLVETLIPKLIDLFSEGGRISWAWRQALIGICGMALSYPVMRGMKVV